MSDKVLQSKMMHDGVEITVGTCIQMIKTSTSDVTMLPYLNSLLYHSIGTGNAELLDLSKQLKTIHGGQPFSLPVSSKVSYTPSANSKISKELQEAARKDQRELFIDRVKKIVIKASEQNGQILKMYARGSESEYKFYIDAQRFCDAVDKLATDHEDKLKSYLGDDLCNINVSKVAQFIGMVVRMYIINNDLIQLKDVATAFSDYYEKKSTVIAKLSNLKISDDDRLLFSTLKGILKSQKTK